MAQLLFLGPQVPSRDFGGVDLERHHLDDRQSVLRDAGELARVVAQEADGADAEVAQNLDADSVVAQVRLEPEADVRLDRVVPFVLQRVRANVVREAKAARKRVRIGWTMGKSLSSIIVWIAPAAAVCLLNASLTFVNVWPTPAITWRGGLSLEFAVCVLALCIAGSRNRVHSRRLIAWI